jgi:hypothetical protein
LGLFKIKNIRGWLIPIISVVGTGLVGAFALALMAAGKFAFVSSEDASRLGIFISYQVLGLTIVKGGVDGLVFAQASTGPCDMLYNLRPIFWRKILPLWLGFTALSYFVLAELYPLMICSIVVLCDVYSAIRTSEFTAKKKFSIVSASNLTKYPLYFVSLFALGAFCRVEYIDLLNLFLIVSVLRLMMLYILSKQYSFQSAPIYSLGVLGVQQVLNYLLFRLDQVSIPLISRSISGFQDEGLIDFVFLVKYPEMASLLSTALGAIVFPKLLALREGKKDNKPINYVYFNLALFFLMTFGLLLYEVLFNKALCSWVIFVPLAIAATLCFEVNYITFLLLAKSQFKDLIIGLSVAVLAGVFMASISAAIDSYDLVYWIVPVQMIAFIGIFNKSKMKTV